MLNSGSADPVPDVRVCSSAAHASVGLRSGARVQQSCTPYDCLVLLVALIASGAASGQMPGRVDPHIPPLPPPMAAKVVVSGEIKYVYPVRWSWVHWWEANRDELLRADEKARPKQPDDPKAVARFRKRSADALRGRLKSKAWQVRASAALALGRMGQADAIDELQQLAAEDDSLTVRRFALVGIGLSGHPRAENILLTQEYPSAAEREAGLVALGLLPTAGRAAVAGLYETVRGKESGSASVSAWALRSRDETQLLQLALAGTKSPWVASEAILSMGRQAKVRTIALLAEILLTGRPGRNIPVWQMLEEGNKEAVLLASTAREGRILTGVEHPPKYTTWEKVNPNSFGRREGDRVVQRDNLIVGLERIYMSRLRASAAIALGQIAQAASRRALVRALALEDDGYGEPYKSMAMLSLGRIGDARSMGPIVEILSPRTPGGAGKTDERRNSPMRGAAAIALGLWAGRAKADADLRAADKLCRLLGERMADRRETMEVRSAAAMALGLTRRAESLEVLRRAGRSVGPGDDPLIGYTMLARAMLSDASIVPAAGRFLTVANDRRTPAGILSRRAAVLALGTLGSREAVPVLKKAWALNYYVNREVAVALALCGAYSACEGLLKLLGDSGGAREQAFAARCLGELFASPPSQRLRRLLAGSNYTMKNKRLTPLQALANEFLFTYLIRSFGETWL